ncbi:unnamed protein product, partial [Urochloa humidicola]
TAVRPHLPFPFFSLVHHPVENGSGGARATGEHGGVPAPAICSCRRQRPTLSPTILDLHGELRGSRETGGGGPVVAASGGHGEAVNPRRAERGDA